MASWMANYELDVVVEDERFAEAMEEMYLEDLEHSTEIVLTEAAKVRPIERRGRHERPRGSARGSAGRAASGVFMIGMALVFLAATAVAILLPVAVSAAFAILCGWAAITLVIKALRLRSSDRK